MVDKQLQVSVASLNPPDKEGWAIKEGGSFKSWKKRWFVLKDKRLWYFKGKTDVEAKGYIELEPGTVVTSEPGNKKHKCMFAINSRGPKGARKFRISPDTTPECNEWLVAIKKNLEGPQPVQPTEQKVVAPEASNAVNAGGATPGPASAAVSASQSSATPVPSPVPAAAAPAVASAAAPKILPGSPRAKLVDIKNAVGFLQEPENKVLEFWQIWTESIPAKEELAAGQAIEFHVSASADLEKLSWRTSGPQNIVIQKMVDFFWNVGAPETEIDRLNDVGALINPIKIGSWIDMSAKCGMDGGWYFPVDIAPKLAIEAADPGEPTKKLLEWCEGHSVTQCFTVGRDMGAAPPRQTEIRLKFPTTDFLSSLNLAVDAFSAFSFAPIPDNVITLVKSHPGEQCTMSVITSSDGFVRLGVLMHKPPPELVKALVEAYGNPEKVAKMDAATNTSPAVLELQHLKAGFGYGVYKEGFDVVLHWSIQPDETS